MCPWRALLRHSQAQEPPVASDGRAQERRDGAAATAPPAADGDALFHGVGRAPLELGGLLGAAEGSHWTQP